MLFVIVKYWKLLRSLWIREGLSQLCYLHTEEEEGLRELTWSDFQDMQWSEKRKVQESFYSTLPFMGEGRQSNTLIDAKEIQE